MREKTPKVLGKKNLEFTKYIAFVNVLTVFKTLWNCFCTFLQVALKAQNSSGTSFFCIHTWRWSSEVLVIGIFLVWNIHLQLQSNQIFEHWTSHSHSKDSRTMLRMMLAATQSGMNFIRTVFISRYDSMRCSFIVVQADEGRKTLTRNGSAFSASSWNKFLLWPNIFR